MISKALAKRIPIAAAAMVAAMFLLPTAGVAQIPIDLPTPTPTPTPDPTPTPSPTKTKDPEPGKTGGNGGGKGGGGTTNPGGGSGGSGGSGRGDAPPAPVLTPEERKGIEKWLTRDRSPARTTTRLLNLLDKSAEGDDLTSEEARERFGRFPVVGYVWYQDDYGAPRYSTHYSFHAGTDLFAVRGTPVNAVVDGYIWNIGSFSRGGNAIWLQGDDGVRYYYGHLAGFTQGLSLGQRVSQGDALGWVGDTGSAKGTYPHVHFEVNPGGLGTVNPKPVLDAWLDQAETAALEDVRAVRLQTRLLPLGAAQWEDLFNFMGEAPAPIASFWMSGLDGSTTITQLDIALARLQSARDWDGLVVSERRLVWDRLSALSHES